MLGYHDCTDYLLTATTNYCSNNGKKSEYYRKPELYRLFIIQPQKHTTTGQPPLFKLRCTPAHTHTMHKPHSRIQVLRLLRYYPLHTTLTFPSPPLLKPWMTQSHIGVHTYMYMYSIVGVLASAYTQRHCPCHGESVSHEHRQLWPPLTTIPSHSTLANMRTLS